MRIVIENADFDDFNELAKLARQGKINTFCMTDEDEKRPQEELANEVWKLYKKHQPYLATRVLEFGDELKELLGKYQKGGAE